MKIKLRITIILISALCIFNGLLTLVHMPQQRMDT